MHVENLIDGNVQGGTLDVAGTNASSSEVDDHLSLGCHRRGDEGGFLWHSLYRSSDLGDGMSAQLHQTLVGGSWSHVVKGEDSSIHSVHLRSLLEWVVGCETAGIDVSRVDAIVDVCQESAFGNGSPPIAHFVDSAQEAFSQLHL